VFIGEAVLSFASSSAWAGALENPTAIAKAATAKRLLNLERMILSFLWICLFVLGLWFAINLRE
jgi:hypothetical protein